MFKRSTLRLNRQLKCRFFVGWREAAEPVCGVVTSLIFLKMNFCNISLVCHFDSLVLKGLILLCSFLV